MPPAQAELLRLAEHELRTPLTSIRGYSELLATGRAGALSEQQQRMAGLIDLCAGKVYGIIEGLIVLAGLGDGSFGLAVEPTPLAPLAARVAAEVATQARAAAVALDVAVPAELTIVADPRHLQRALAGLVRTAIDFAPARGTVRLAARTPAGGGTQVVVTGPAGGPAAGEQLELYDRCLRADAGPADLEGPGLGLAVAHAVVAHHGGTVTAGADGTGVAVTVTLPAAPPDDPACVVVRRRSVSGSPRG
ncbi:sensor histidine kinase [Dactylosporangium sp. NPDC051541]|uniref:sensor histidine kinase n=1 Tax=Dactylosporangium sp. NPDC051541 TaxID=3363977 RepID=UPI0037BCFC77